MGHRKVYSQGSIPFSWEDEPGVCKIAHQECPTPIDVRRLHLHALKLTSSKSPTRDIKIPLPPCPQHVQPPRRSTSKKGHLWQQEEVDPFLVAYNECTKSVTSSKKAGIIGSKLRKTKSILSCKNSCEVKEGNILKLSHQLPSLPRYHINGTASIRERQECLREHKAWDLIISFCGVTFLDFI